MPSWIEQLLTPEPTEGFYRQPPTGRLAVGTPFELVQTLNELGLISSVQLLPDVWLGLTGDDLSPNQANWKPFTWDEAVHDPYGYWDGADEITLPAGKWYVEFNGTITGVTSSVAASIGILKDDLSVAYSREYGSEISNGYGASCFCYLNLTAPLSIVAASFEAASAVHTLTVANAPSFTATRLG